MQTREPRQTIRVTARMKWAGGWQDVAIQNVSAHGMKVTASQLPSRGAYIEIRRASQVIVARIVWSAHGECGLRTQDVIDVPALVNPDAARAEGVIKAAHAERRYAPRLDDVAARSHRIAATAQYGVIAGAICLAALCAAWAIGSTLTAPFDTIRAALEGGASKEGSIAPQR